jgi:hypothetical protein
MRMRTEVRGLRTERRLQGLVVFALTFVAGLAYLASPWFRASPAFSEEERVGIHLARGEGFLSPFADGGSAPPTSWCAPVYPMIVGAVYHWMGVRSPTAIVSILMFNMACRAAAATALLRLGGHFFNLAAGLLTAILFVVNPIFLHAATLGWDNSLALATFLWLIVTAIRIDQLGVSRGRLIALGIGSGLLLLTNPAYCLAVPMLILMAAGVPLGLSAKTPGRQDKAARFLASWRLGAGSGSLASVIAIAAVLTPWTMRNYAQFGRWIFVRGNLNVELWLGNQPGSTGWMTMAALEHHPSEDAVNRGQVLSLGETRYFQLCRERFVAECRGAPLDFIRRCGNRLAYLLVGEPNQSLAWLNESLALLGLAGFFIAWRRGIGVVPMAAAAFFSTAAYLPTQVHDRYALPLRAVLTLGAAYAISSAWSLAAAKTAGVVEHSH